MTYKDYFKKICSIPHGSGNLKAMQQYLSSFASENGLECYIDEFENVIIKRPSDKTALRRGSIVLQAHYDMVAVATDDRDMNDEKIALFEEDGFFVADGTSLGADDGIGCAYILSILSDKELKTGEIIGLFTADEETGMSGARGLDFQNIRSRFLINLDSEQEGKVVTSSAGGVLINMDVDISAAKTQLTGTIVELIVSGLRGGHSGIDIADSGVSAAKILADFSFAMLSRFNLKLINIKSGNVANAIAENGSVKFLLPDSEDFDTFKAAFMQQIDKVILRYQKQESEISLKPRFVRGRFNTSGEVVEYLKRDCFDFDNKRLFQLISSFPQGVIEKYKDEVRVSNNIGVCSLDYTNMKLKVSMLLRSNDSVRLAQFRNKFMNDIEACNINKLNISSKIISQYEPWEAKPQSHLLSVACQEYEKLYSSPLEKASIHAGLECGLLSHKNSDLDVISIGPNIYGVHTTAECAEIESCQRTYDFLKNIILNI